MEREKGQNVASGETIEALYLWIMEIFCNNLLYMTLIWYNFWKSKRDIINGTIFHYCVEIHKGFRYRKK